MSRRSDILDAIATLYGGASVIRAPVQTAYDELKAAGGTLTGVFVGENEDVQKEGYQQYNLTLPVTVERIKAYESNSAWATRQAERAAQAETLLAALQLVAMGADQTLGGACDLMDYAGGIVLLPDDASYVVGAAIVLRVRYRFSIYSPNDL